MTITRRDEVKQLLNERNDVGQLADAIENELEFLFQTFEDKFFEFFYENGVESGTYGGLKEEDEDYAFEWESEFLNEAIEVWQQRMNARFKERRGNA